MDLRKYMQKEIQNSIKVYTQKISKLEKDFIEIEKLEDIYNWNGYFEIFITSEDDGFRIACGGDGQNIRYQNKSPQRLKDVITAACLEFIGWNYESLNFKNFCYIKIILPNETSITLSKEYWKEQVKEAIKNIYELRKHK